MQNVNSQILKKDKYTNQCTKHSPWFSFFSKSQLSTLCLSNELLFAHYYNMSKFDYIWEMEIYNKQWTLEESYFVYLSQKLPQNKTQDATVV